MEPRPARRTSERHETHRRDSPDRARHHRLHRLWQLASSGTNSVQSTTPTTEPRTDVMITYTVPTCPPGARCVQFPATKFYIVSRQLTCSPAGGNYADADAACQALSDVDTKLGKKNWVCGCAAQADGYIPPEAVGYYDGKRRTIPLDGCSLCNLPGVGADVALLLPGIHG